MSESLLKVEQAFDRAVQFVIHFARERGIDDAFPLRTFQVQYFKPVEPSRATLVIESRTERSFTLFYSRWREELDAAEPIVTLNSLCESFSNMYGIAMEKYWKKSYGTMMVSRYFKKAQRFAHEPSVVIEVVHEFESDLTASQEQIELVYYVEGLRADVPFSLMDGDISFSPVSEADLRKYAERNEITIALKDFDLSLTGWTCRILLQGDKPGFNDLNKATDILDQILNAFSLVSDGNARFRLLSKDVANPFLHMGRVSGGEPVNSGRGGPIYLTTSDVQKLDNMLRRLALISTDERLRLLRYPLRRMRSAANRRSIADAFLDTVVALEGLLAHDTPALESTYRFRLRGAALSSDEFGSPQERLKTLGDMYSMRSRIVHGDNISATLDPLLAQADRILKSIFLRYLEFSKSIKPEDVIRTVDEWMVKHTCIAPINQ